MVFCMRMSGVCKARDTSTQECIDVSAMCMPRALLMQHVSLVLLPPLDLPPLVQRLHYTLHCSLVALSFCSNME